MNVQELRDDLLRRMSITASCRFAAAERLERRDRLLTILNAAATTTVISFSVTPLALRVGVNTSSTITLLTIVASLALLTTSLLQYSLRDAVSANLHHRCAREINGLWRALKYREILTVEEISDVNGIYARVLESYDLNHSQRDYLRSREQRAALLQKEEEQKPNAGSEPKAHLVRQFFEANSPFREKLFSQLAAIAGVTAMLASIVYVAAQINRDHHAEHSAMMRVEREQLVAQEPRPLFELIAPDAITDLQQGIRARISNSGPTPALNVETSIAVIIQNHNPTASEFAAQHLDTPVQYPTLDGNTAVEFHENYNVPDVDKAKLIAGQMLYVFGIMTYLDDSGSAHKRPFCQALMFKPDGSLRSRAICSLSFATRP